MQLLWEARPQGIRQKYDGGPRRRQNSESATEGLTVCLRNARREVLVFWNGNEVCQETEGEGGEKNVDGRWRTGACSVGYQGR